MKEIDFKALNFTVLGKACEYEGDLRLRGDAMICSRVLGSLTMLDESKLVIEREAYIEGSIYCKDIEVFGEVNGSINASGKLTVRSSAKVSGKISAANMSIYPGAILNMEGSTQSQESQA